MYFLLPGPKRYGELRRAARGVSDKMLIQHLKELEADEIVTRRDYRETPPRVDYALTPLGRRLAELLAPLCDWGHRQHGGGDAHPRRSRQPADYRSPWRFSLSCFGTMITA